MEWQEILRIVGEIAVLVISTLLGYKKGQSRRIKQISTSSIITALNDELQEFEEKRDTVEQVKRIFRNGNGTKK